MKTKIREKEEGYFMCNVMVWEKGTKVFCVIASTPTLQSNGINENDQLHLVNCKWNQDDRRT